MGRREILANIFLLNWLAFSNKIPFVLGQAFLGCVTCMLKTQKDRVWDWLSALGMDMNYTK